MQPLFTPHRKAIAMIELIFAIVVMGIVMLTAPIMLTTATKSSSVTFQQESIAIVATQANSLLTYAWDENNTDSATYTTLSILSTQSSTTALERNATLFGTMLRRKASTALDKAASATLSFGEGQDSGDTYKDDIDDFNGYTNTLQVTAHGTDTTTAENEYMDIDIAMLTNVAYGKDAPSDPTFATCSTTACAFSRPFIASAPTGTTNIKLITTTLTSSKVPDKNIMLKSFICNIGSIKPQKRVF